MYKKNKKPKQKPCPFGERLKRESLSEKKNEMLELILLKQK